MRLDIGGFIEGLDKENAIRNRCKTCGRDKILNSKRTELPTTEVKQRCPECKAPLIWIKTSSSGEREEHEWLIQDRKEVVRQGRKGKSLRIELD